MVYCRKCGEQLEDQAKFCGKCGTTIAPETDSFVDSQAEIKEHEKNGLSQDTKNQNAEEKKPEVLIINDNQDSGGLRTPLICGAIGVAILTIIAFVYIILGSNEIKDIRSVGGQTMEEAYYAEIGKVYTGLGYFVLLVGGSLTYILSWMASKSKRSQLK